ncbi:PQQ-binding-like beta-propeller repeat protein [archaeon]|nr:PQQ-binding-like beta-propeller repeat protein [archaeon]
MNRYIWVLFFVILPTPTVSASTCQKNVYYLTPGYSFAQGNMVLGYIDMDLSNGGPQKSVKIPPGELTTVEIAWGWGPNCPDCMVYINSFGSWSPNKDIMKLYSGPKGEFQSNSKIPISFRAPDIPGAYKFRVIFAYDEEYAIDFDGSNLCSEAECKARGECSVLIAEGDINVTTLDVSGKVPLKVELTSPKTKEVSGVLKANIGSVIPINADITSPPNTTVNVTIEIDDREVSGLLPFSWNTFNSTHGTHLIVVIAKDENGALAYDELEVFLQNKSGEYGAVPPIVWRQRIKGTVNDVDISENGAYIAAGSADGFAYLFDKSGKRIWEQELSSSIASVSIDALGEILLFASGNTLYYFNGDGQLIWNYTNPDPTIINSVALNRAGDKIAFSAGNILYYLTGNGTLLWTYSTSNPITSIAVNSLGTNVASASENVLYYFNGDGTLDWTYSSSTRIDSVALNLDGNRVAFASGGSLYYMDNLASLLWNFTGVSDATLSSDGSLILAKSDNILFALSNRGSLIWKEISENNLGVISVSSGGKFLIYSEGDSIFMRDSSQITITEQPEIWIYALAALSAILVLGLFIKRKRISSSLQKIGINGLKAKSSKEDAALASVKVAALRIIVTNNKTKRTIKGTKVLCGQRVAYTDEQGEAIFEGVQFGEHFVTVEKESYMPGQEARVVGEGENRIEIALLPQVGATGKNEEILKGILYNLSREYESVSSYDTCLPNYYKSIGDRIVEFLETLGHSPEFFEAKNRAELLGSFIDVGSITCEGIRDVISDWRNVKLYQAASELQEAHCSAKEIEIEKLRAVLTNSEALRHETERRLTELDKKMMDHMNKLTIIPVSTLWQVSKDLLRESAAVSGYRKLAMLFFASILTEYTDNMLESEEIVKRLKLAIL